MFQLPTTFFTSLPHAANRDAALCITSQHTNFTLGTLGECESTCSSDRRRAPAPHSSATEWRGRTLTGRRVERKITYCWQWAGTSLLIDLDHIATATPPPPLLPSPSSPSTLAGQRCGWLMRMAVEKFGRRAGVRTASTLMATESGVGEAVALMSPIQWRAACSRLTPRCCRRRVPRDCRAAVQTAQNRRPRARAEHKVRRTAVIGADGGGAAAGRQRGRRQGAR
jgi:hypothetical protein